MSARRVIKLHSDGKAPCTYPYYNFTTNIVISKFILIEHFKLYKYTYKIMNQFRVDKYIWKKNILKLIILHSVIAVILNGNEDDYKDDMYKSIYI